jgi:hypothetical protein
MDEDKGVFDMRTFLKQVQHEVMLGGDENAKE